MLEHNEKVSLYFNATLFQLIRNRDEFSIDGAFLMSARAAG